MSTASGLVFRSLDTSTAVRNSVRWIGSSLAHSGCMSCAASSGSGIRADVERRPAIHDAAHGSGDRVAEVMERTGSGADDRAQVGRPAETGVESTTAARDIAAVDGI